MVQERSDASQVTAHLLLDLSGLLAAARTIARSRGERDSRLALHAAHLKQVMAAGRALTGSTVVADEMVDDATLLPFRLCFDEVLVAGGAPVSYTTDQLLGSALERAVEAATPGSTVVVATAEGDRGKIGQNLAAAMVGAIGRNLRVELLSLACSSSGVIGKLQRALGVVVCLDPHYDSITYVQGGRSAIGQTIPPRAAMGLEPWHWAALRDADDALHGQPLCPFPWRRLRSIPEPDAEAFADLAGWFNEVGEDGDLDAALDRFGLRISRRNRAVRNFAAIMRAVDVTAVSAA
jgi:hypothetical protein